MTVFICVRSFFLYVGNFSVIMHHYVSYDATVIIISSLEHRKMVSSKEITKVKSSLGKVVVMVVDL